MSKKNQEHKAKITKENPMLTPAEVSALAKKQRQEKQAKMAAALGNPVPLPDVTVKTDPVASPTGFPPTTRCCGARAGTRRSGRSSSSTSGAGTRPTSSRRTRWTAAITCRKRCPNGSTTTSRSSSRNAPKP